MHRSTLYHHINSEVTSPLRVDLQTFPESQDAGIGTCTLLRHISGRITKDFVLLPCDFIAPPSFSLQSILDRFRADIVTEGAVMTTCWYPTPRREKGQHPDEWPSAKSGATILYDAEEETLLYIDTPDDLECNSEDFDLRMSMLLR